MWTSVDCKLAQVMYQCAPAEMNKKLLNFKENIYWIFLSKVTQIGLQLRDIYFPILIILFTFCEIVLVIAVVHYALGFYVPASDGHLLNVLASDGQLKNKYCTF